MKTERIRKMIIRRFIRRKIVRPRRMVVVVSPLGEERSGGGMNRQGGLGVKLFRRRCRGRWWKCVLEELEGV